MKLNSIVKILFVCASTIISVISFIAKSSSGFRQIDKELYVASTILQ